MKAAARHVERGSANGLLAWVFKDGWTLLAVLVLVAIAWPLVAGAVLVWMFINVVFEAVAPVEADRAADGWGPVPIGGVLIFGALALGSGGAEGGSAARPPEPATASAEPAQDAGDELHLDELAESFRALVEASTRADPDEATG